VRTYELMVVIQADLSDEDLNARIETIGDWVEANGGKVVGTERWGHRRLAYPIHKQRDGYYVLFRVEMPPTAPAEVERNLQIAEDVLRYLIVREDE
jgi:small subunit ribosomal protein S6